jgi:hypothetical protein
MASDGGDSSSGVLTSTERERLAALAGAESLADLTALTVTDDEHEAYLAAKPEWRDLRDRVLPPATSGDGFPGARVTVDGHRFHVHGITHADTAAEGSFVREHVSRALDRGATVYCETGIRPMYFAEFAAVYEMDDYRWALARCRELGVDSRVSDLVEPPFEGLAEQVASLGTRFQDAVFSLVHAGADVYGEEFRQSLGDVATEFLTSHAELATGEDFASYALSRRAAEDPTALGALQRYYETAFLPQPVEREWLRRHDRELELVTHARNERMADYAVAHNEDATEVHLLVGAAHQPGVRYYLEQYRDGERDAAGFELVG